MVSRTNDLVEPNETRVDSGLIEKNSSTWTQMWTRHLRELFTPAVRGSGHGGLYLVLAKSVGLKDF